MTDQDPEQEMDVEEAGEPDTAPAGGPVVANRLGGPADDLIEFVEYLVQNIVDDPQAVEIIPERFGQTIHIKLRVTEEEIGKVIGRQGRIARSMRTLLMIAAARKGLRASLDIDS
jgi:hypothetical protein